MNKEDVMRDKKVVQFKQDFYIDAIRGIMNANNGYVTSRMVTELGIHRMYLKILDEKKVIKRVGTGVYLDSTKKKDNYYIFHLTTPNAVFSHMTALYLHGYLDRIDEEYNITIKDTYHNLRFKNYNTFYVTDKVFDLGLIEIETKFGNKIKIYDVERCICDIIKSKKRMNMKYFKMCIRKYFAQKNVDYDKLLDYAEKLGITDKVMVYVEIFR